MKIRLFVLSLAALFGLIGVSTWAAMHVSIVPAIATLVNEPGAGFNPWTIATLFDAYFGFLWFYAWIAYKETGWTARLGWLVAVLLTGNMAMAVYMLVQLRRLPANARAEDLLLRRS
jgi:hypothetical protein